MTSSKTSHSVQLTDPSQKTGVTSDLSVVLLGFTVSDDQLRALGANAAAAAAQTHNFAWSLVKALQEGGCDVGLLSTLPVHDYPRHRRLVMSGGRFDAPTVSEGRLVGFVNLRGAKHLSRFIGFLLQGLPLLRSRRARVVLVHGVHLPCLWFSQLARRRFRVTTVIILTDPPGVVLPSDGPLTRLMRRLDRTLIRRALAGVDGAICLTEELGTEFTPTARHLVMEGIVNPRLEAVRTQQQSTSDGGFTVAYAGGLKTTYGVARLVEAVGILPENISVDFYGTGPLEPWLRLQAAQSRRIHFHGTLPHHELITALSNADLLVNPRPTTQEFARYSFPSKLLEYMALGRPVLTTRLAGIPAEYSDKLLFADDSAEGIAVAILNACRMSTAEREAVGATARRFALTEKGARRQGERIRAFLDELVHNRR